MITGNRGQTAITLDADTPEYRFVQSDGTTTASSTDEAEGVTVAPGDADEDVGITVAGIVRVKMTGSGSKFDEIMPNSDGKGQAAAASGNEVHGKALEDWTAGKETWCLIYEQPYTN